MRVAFSVVRQLRGSDAACMCSSLIQRSLGTQADPMPGLVGGECKVVSLNRIAIVIQSAAMHDHP